MQVPEATNFQAKRNSSFKEPKGLPPVSRWRGPETCFRTAFPTGSSFLKSVLGLDKSDWGCRYSTYPRIVIHTLQPIISALLTIINEASGQ